jgi:hypothetical protein
MPDYVHAHGMIVRDEPGFVPLFYGDGDAQTKKIVLTAGSLKRGALLGRVGTTNNYVLATAAAADGSQTPANFVILAVDTDATAGARETICYFSSDQPFNERALTLGAGIVLDTPTRDILQGRGLTFKAGIDP